MTGKPRRDWTRNESRQRTHLVGVRMNPVESALLQAEAVRRKQTMAAVLRAAFLASVTEGEAPGKVSKRMPEVVTRLRTKGPGTRQCPAIMPGPPPAIGEYRCELGEGHGVFHISATRRWEIAGD